MNGLETSYVSKLIVLALFDTLQSLFGQLLNKSADKDI